MAPTGIPLPESVVKLIQSVPLNERHPGLQLDKYIEAPASQEQQKESLKSVLEAATDEHLLQEVTRRREAILQQLGAVRFTAKTAGPMTLHLARASALENAGICLHSLYGFVYFPGSGLKGMARAYAETVWLPLQSDQQKAWRQIEDVFGWASNPTRRQQISDPNHPAQVRRVNDSDPKSSEISASAGNIVFHDAWPVRWPKLQLDIVNNHHTEYYRNEQAAPGDWEDPEMVSFLAIGPGEEFNFALSKRRSDVADKLLYLAALWLAGALTYEGLGAKTAAGYGAFIVSSPPVPAPKPPAREVFEATLELVTPAFLAGPNQNADNCDLRPATLRGLLRWWWRTMHAGYVDLPTLHRLEAAVWGDTNCGGPVRITVQREDPSSPSPVPVPGKSIRKDKNNRDVLRPDQEFIRQQKLALPPDQKTTHGFLYLSYGMDEMPAGKPEERRRRFIMPPGAKWRVRLMARDGFYRPVGASASAKPVRIPAAVILEQAKAALWLLCHYGGVGSKGRNGFGSLVLLDDGDTQNKRGELERAAAEFRHICGVNEQIEPHCQIPALRTALPEVLVSTPWKNHWFVLDQLGYSLQSFAQKYKRKWIKEALGLPRRIGISDDDGSQSKHYQRDLDRKTKQPVVWLGQKHPYRGNRKPKDMRHAAPVHFHIARSADGTYQIRVIAFPCAVLPDWKTSNDVLQKLLAHLREDLQKRCDENSRDSTLVSPAIVSRALPRIPEKRPAGTPVQVKILAERPKGGYEVQEEGKPQGTLTVGTPPTERPEVGDIVSVEVHNDDPRRPQYRWPQNRPPMQSDKYPSSRR